MSLFEENTHAFILRIWLEPREIEGDGAEWRGTIEHVGTGQRRHFRDLNDIIFFIAPHLEAMGVELGLRWRIQQWMKSLGH